MILAMPMNGEGQRFKDAGYAIPKPFILVNGTPLYQLALASYPMVQRRILVARTPVATQLVVQVGRDIPVALDEATQGPLETLLHPTVIPLIDNEHELLIADCDALINPDELRWCLTRWRPDGASGGVTVRHTTDPNVSYAELCLRRAQERWKVLRTGERERVSEWSTTGPYWWKRGSDFVRCGHKAMAGGTTGISPVYNTLIAEEGKVFAIPVATFEHLGTPKSLEDYALRHRPALE